MDAINDADDILSHVSHLVRSERSALAALARAEGVTPEDAVDCVQEGLCTLLTLAQQRGALPEDAGAWGGVLAAMVRNAARNRRRRHFRARPHEDVDAHPEAAGDSPATDEAIARAEEHVRLRACVEELCEIQKAVVTLRMLEEQPGEDVARALGISAGHVAVLLHRAKLALRACMTSPS
ncbi:RNA polymerase sigma factor [Sorangium cellulosum]|uniref:RNA polymerase subunit sigma n=1 Tax=Sorangium cellulosum TaxID=56 RepID=A0A150QYK7_SORCE|nr:RNA polymerase sigma factor [Sorangium cellulosum]KYF73002.1 RNA polymerase subunit sigma [Sorangium cellulosum]